MTSNWYRGNLHMHSLWSDGDDFPEMIADWFKSHGYNFIAFTEHDRLQEGEMWFDASDRAQRNPKQDLRGVGDRYRARFGPGWVQTRTQDGRELIRLKPLDEYRQQFEEAGRFLILSGEEITVHAGDRRHWMNAINLSTPISPQTADDSPAAMQQVISAARAQSQRSGRASLVQLNHPNFAWNATAADILRVPGLDFVEIHAALGSTRCYGDATHPPVERIWDEVLTQRLGEPGQRVLYGTFGDDSHFHHNWDAPNPYGHPGCTWMMVHTLVLTAEAIVEALLRGDSYGSSGVFLKELTVDQGRFIVAIEAEAGVNYLTQFIGTRHGETEFGQVLAEVRSERAEYRFRGNELYVRARVRSSKPHPRPHAAGDVETAWTQPQCPGRVSAVPR